MSVAVNAQPARAGIEKNRAVVGEAPKAIKPTLSKPVEKTVPKPGPDHKIYVVQAGDTVKRIASAAGVSAEAVRAENPGYDFIRMKVGNQVFLPAAAMISLPADQYYFVEPGDTLTTIAQKRDLLPDELRILNPETNLQKLRVGQRIRAP